MTLGYRVRAPLSLERLHYDPATCRVAYASSDRVRERSVGALDFLADLSAMIPGRSPSSSTGEVHPADEINRGSRALRSLREVEMGDRVCSHYNVTGLKRDEIVGALAVHFIERGGSPWHGHAGDHGPQGESYPEQVWQILPGAPDDVAHPERHMSVLVGLHMALRIAAPPEPGKKYGARDPTVRRNVDEKIVSWSDYLGALGSVDLDAPK